MAKRHYLPITADVPGISDEKRAFIRRVIRTALAAEGVEGVLIYGVDFTADARAAIKEGTMTGSMSYSSVKYTEAALKMACAMIAGTEYAEPIYLPLTLASVDNVNELDAWN